MHILNTGTGSILPTPLCTAVCCVGQTLYAIVINAHSQHRYREHTAYTPLYCGMLCGGDPACKSFDYDPLQQRCYLGSVAVGSDCQEMVTGQGGSQHYAEVSDLLHPCRLTC